MEKKGMKRRFLLSLICSTASFLTVATAFVALSPETNFGVVEAAPGKVTQGALQALGSDGRPRAECPLKHTEVKAEVSGQLARVTVTQEFHNPFRDKIEAVYVFPLPQSAAVDDMTMIVGDRTVKGKIKRREEAQAIYEAAREAGQTAGLLDQERPNIFTQSVANIVPGAEVKITISYVEFLRYEEGTYEFVFPMVVSPRYIPGRPVGKRGGGWTPDTNKVPDASRITPRVAPKGMRAGHDISIEVKLDAGVPIDGLKSKLHEVDVARTDNHRAVVRLKDQATIPNKDFILKFDVAGKTMSDAVMTHRGTQGGFFTLILQPPERANGRHAERAVLRARRFRLDGRFPDREGEGDDEARPRQPLPRGHLQPDYIFWRHSRFVSSAGPSDARKPATGAEFSRVPSRLGRDRDDEGYSRRARPVRRTRSCSDRLFHDRRAGRQRHGDHLRNPKTPERARLRVRHRLVDEPIPAGQNGRTR